MTDDTYAKQLATLQDALLQGKIDRETYESLKKDLQRAGEVCAVPPTTSGQGDLEPTTMTASQENAKEPLGASLEDRLKQEAMWREYLRSTYGKHRFSLVGRIASLILGPTFWFFALWLLLGFLIDVEVLSDVHLPHETRFVNPAKVSPLIYVYLCGASIGLLSIAIYRRVNKLERAIRYNRVTNMELEWLHGRGAEVAELIRLEKGKDNLPSGRREWHRLITIIERKKHDLFGSQWISLITLIALIALNWVALGSHLVYGVQWLYPSKWIAIPIMILWAANVLWFSITPLVTKRIPQPE